MLKFDLNGMPYILLSLFGIIKYRKGNSLSFILFLLLFLSSISAYMVGRQPNILDLEVLLYSLYISVLLFVLYNSFNQYKNVKSIGLDGISLRRIRYVENFLICTSSIVFIIYVYIFCHSLNLLITNSVTVNDFKNDADGASKLFENMFPHFVITSLNLLCPLALFDIVFHFYYVFKRKIKKAVLFFILSLVYPLSGLIALSRSSSVQFILLYFALYFFLFPLFEEKIRKIYNKIILVFFVLIVSIFSFISISRFSDYYTKESKQASIISEESAPLMFSIFDYFSQWEENGPEILMKYKPHYKFYGLYNSSGLALQIKRLITKKDEVTKVSNQMERIVGRQWMMFHGLIARLVYDFGYIGTVLFILVYAKIIKSYKPVNGVINLKSLMILVIFLPIALMSFQGNSLGGIYLNLALIYLFVIFKFISYKSTIRSRI